MTERAYSLKQIVWRNQNIVVRDEVVNIWKERA